MKTKRKQKKSQMLTRAEVWKKVKYKKQKLNGCVAQSG